jgi:aminoglycoside phosphotransferase (APT) family kinase protein
MTDELGKLIGQGRTAQVYAWGEGQVLKLFLKEYSNEAAREFRITKGAHDLGAPVPAVEQMIEIDGRQGIIFERITGPTMMEALQSHPWRLVRYARTMAELHAEIHSHEEASLPSLLENLEAAFRQREGIPESLRQIAIDSLLEVPDGNTVLHFDLHPINILLSPSGPVVIDWMTAKRGDPLADVARTMLLMTTGTQPPAGALTTWLANRGRGWFVAAYLKRYRKLRPYVDRELSAWRVPMAAARLVFENLTGEERQRALAIVAESMERPS